MPRSWWTLWNHQGNNVSIYPRVHPPPHPKATPQADSPEMQHTTDVYHFALSNLCCTSLSSGGEHPQKIRASGSLSLYLLTGKRTPERQNAAPVRWNTHSNSQSQNCITPCLMNSHSCSNCSTDGQPSTIERHIAHRHKTQLANQPADLLNAYTQHPPSLPGVHGPRCLCGFI